MCDLLILSVDAIVGASTLRSVAEALGQQLDTAQVCTGFGTAMASAPVISARVVLLSSQPGRLDVPTISTAMKWTQKGGSLVCMEPPSKVLAFSLLITRGRWSVCVRSVSRGRVLRWLGLALGGPDCSVLRACACLRLPESSLTPSSTGLL